MTHKRGIKIWWASYQTLFPSRDILIPILHAPQSIPVEPKEPKVVQLNPVPITDCPFTPLTYNIHSSVLSGITSKHSPSPKSKAQILISGIHTKTLRSHFHFFTGNTQKLDAVLFKSRI